MRLLRGNDAELNPMDSEGLTPLAGAVQCGYVGTVKTLLGCPHVDLDFGDRDRRLLTSFVAKVGCEEVLRMLSNRANVDPNLVEGIDK